MGNISIPEIRKAGSIRAAFLQDISGGHDPAEMLPADLITENAALVYSGVLPAVILIIIIAKPKEAILVRLREIQKAVLFAEHLHPFPAHHSALPEQTEHALLEFFLLVFRDMRLTDAVQKCSHICSPFSYHQFFHSLIRFSNQRQGASVIQ